MCCNFMERQSTMAMFPHSKEYRKTPKFSSLSEFFKVLFLIIVCTELLFAEKVVPDLFPINIGNSWTFALSTGGTREYTVAQYKDSLIFIEKNIASGYSKVDSFSIAFYDRQAF